MTNSVNLVLLNSCVESETTCLTHWRQHNLSRIAILVSDSMGLHNLILRKWGIWQNSDFIEQLLYLTVASYPLHPSKLHLWSPLIPEMLSSVSILSKYYPRYHLLSTTYSCYPSRPAWPQAEGNTSTGVILQNSNSVSTLVRRSKHMEGVQQQPMSIQEENLSWQKHKEFLLHEHSSSAVIIQLAANICTGEGGSRAGSPLSRAPPRPLKGFRAPPL